MILSLFRFLNKASVNRARNNSIVINSFYLNLATTLFNSLYSAQSSIVFIIKIIFWFIIWEAISQSRRYFPFYHLSSWNRPMIIMVKPKSPELFILKGRMQVILANTTCNSFQNETFGFRSKNFDLKQKSYQL